GQGAHADRRARVLAALAEHLDEEVGAAVDHLGLVLEVGHGVHHAEHLDHALHLVEAAELGAHHRDKVEAHGARVLVGLFHGVLAPDLALRPLAVLARARALAGEEKKIARAHRVHVVGHRRRHRAELDFEVLQPLFGTHWNGTTLPGFIRFSGSNTFLISRITSRTSSPSSMRIEPILPMPTPCSPVQVPSRRSARSTRRLLNALASSVSSGFAGSTRNMRWKLPSPMWPSSGTGAM